MPNIIQNKLLEIITTLLMINVAGLRGNGSGFKPVMEPPFDMITISSNQIIVDDLEAEVYKKISEWQIEPVRGSGFNFRYFLHPGSGRYWTVGFTNSVSESGFYFNTTTIGFRNAGPYIDGALPWIKDFNNDGTDEIIIWDSYLAFESGTNLDYGLIAWVYEKSSSSSFAINLGYSIRIWERIAESYKKRCLKTVI